MSEFNKEMADLLDSITGKNAERVGVRGWLNSGIPELNSALSGDPKNGVPMGRVIEIFGPAGSGKTFLATMLMASAQQAGGLAGFSDHERSFDPIMAQSLGLQITPDKWRYVRPQTFEDSIDTAIQLVEKVREAKIMPDDAPIVWCFDSVASMIPHSKLYDKNNKRRDSKTYNMNDNTSLARATSQSYPMLVQWAEDYNMTVLLLNQIRTKPGVMFGDPTTTPGGQAAEYYASQRMSLGLSKIDNGKTGKDKEITGFKVKATVIKNKVSRPHRKASWVVTYNETGGVTVDIHATLVDYLIRIGVIEKKGAKVTFEGVSTTEKKLVASLKKHDKGLDSLYAMIPEAVPELEAEGDADVEI